MTESLHYTAHLTTGASRLDKFCRTKKTKQKKQLTKTAASTHALAPAPAPKTTLQTTPVLLFETYFTN